MSSLPLPVAAFLAGLISFLSPCVLPLVPGYVSLISGAGVDELKSSEGRLKRRVMVNSIAFILGFSVVFIALGAAATEIGEALGYYRSFLAREAGVLIILFGLHMTGLVTIKALYSDVRLHSVKGNSTIWGSFAVGFAFAFGWTPCVGPILSVILGFASAESSLFKGVLLLATYSLGLAVPFLLTSLGIGEFLKFYSRFKRHMHVVEVGSGVLLIALGELLVFDRFTLISNWLSSLGRFEVWLESVVTHSAFIALGIAAIVVVLVVGLYAAFRRDRPAPAQPVNTDPEQLDPAALAQPNEGQPVIARSRNPLALVVASVVAAGMLYFGFHAARRSESTPEQQPRLGYATPAPDFTLESLDGPSVTLSNLHGKAVLLNFWATWCGPCRIETPWLVELQKQYGPQGLQIIGVEAGEDDKDEITKFAKEMGMNYPILLGKESVDDAYGGMPALPESFFIGRDGKIVDKIIGLRGREDIEESIKKALNTQTGGATPAATASAVAVPK